MGFVDYNVEVQTDGWVKILEGRPSEQEINKARRFMEFVNNAGFHQHANLIKQALKKDALNGN